MNSMKKMNRNKISNTFLARQSFKEYHFIFFEDESRSAAASDVPQLIKYQPTNNNTSYIGLARMSLRSFFLNSLE